MVVAPYFVMECSEELPPLELDVSIEVKTKCDFFLKQLNGMLADIPRKYQKKISEDLCAQLAHCLTNDVNFEIVKGLMDIQHVTERYLFHLRLKVISKQQSETLKAVEGKTIVEQDGIRAALAVKHKKQLVDVDMKLVKQLDQKVAEQQDTLQKAGFPGFYVTTNTTEIKVQMFLLDFILRLSKMEIPSNSSSYS